MFDVCFWPFNISRTIEFRSNFRVDPSNIFGAAMLKIFGCKGFTHLLWVSIRGYILPHSPMLVTIRVIYSEFLRWWQRVPVNCVDVCLWILISLIDLGSSGFQSNFGVNESNIGKRIFCTILSKVHLDSFQNVKIYHYFKYQQQNQYFNFLN